MRQLLQRELERLVVAHRHRLLQLGRDGGEYAISIPTLGWFLAVYYVLAVLLFGIAVPSGNFVPAMTARRPRATPAE